MKKNTGAQLALYPSPVLIIGAMVDGKPNWTLVAHAGVHVGGDGAVAVATQVVHGVVEALLVRGAGV